MQYDVIGVATPGPREETVARIAIPLRAPGTLPGFCRRAAAIGAAVAVGLVFGINPASRAAALSPIEALRHE